MKYPNMQWGTMEAVVNKLGGIEGVERFLRGELVVSERQIANAGLVEHTIDFDRVPSIPDGWSILPDEEQLPNRVCGQIKFDSTIVALYLDSGQKGNRCIDGYKLRKKLANVHVCGAQLGDFYSANAHLLPEEWEGKVVIFWGTIYRNADGRPTVRFFCGGQKCLWSYFELHNGFDSVHHAAVLAI